MKKLSRVQLIGQYCKLSGKWAVAISIPHDFTASEIKSVAPFIDMGDDGDAVFDRHMIIICDSETECNEIFNTFEYRGPIYAYTVNSDGGIEEENT